MGGRVSCESSGHGSGPERGAAKDALDRVGADHEDPVVGFGELIGEALLAPSGMLLPQRDDLLFDRGIGTVRLFGRHTGELMERGIAARIEARFPIVEGSAPDMGGTTGQGDVATRLSGLEQQPALLSRGERKMDAFGHAGRSWHDPVRCAKSVCPYKLVPNRCHGGQRCPHW
jgi:hypothetical protein